MNNLPRRRPTESEIDSSPLRVLLVEDDPPRSPLLSWALRDSGLVVCEVPRALALVVAEHGRPEAAVLNLRAGHGEKRAFIRSLRQRAHRMCVIDLFDDVTPPTGADGYLQESAPAIEIAELLRSLVPAWMRVTR